MEKEGGLNALQENIARKGRNAYYYAHELKASGPEWDGAAAPRLIERQRSEPAPTKQAITRYSWADADAKVKVYIPFDRPEPVVKLDWTETSLSLAIDAGEAQFALRIPKLYDRIVGASYKQKSDKIVLTLNKPPDNTFKWVDLKKTT